MTQYNIGFDPTQPLQIVFTATAMNAGQTTYKQLVTNRDPINTLLIGFEQNHQTPDFTSPMGISIMDPLSSLVVDGTVNVWAIAQVPAGGNLPVPPILIADVVPTAIGTSGSPLAIATAIATGELPIFIAQAIASQGISLFGNPVLLYGGGSVNPPPTPLVGYTGTTSIFPAGTTWTQVISLTDQYVNRTIAASAAKIYLQEGSWPTTIDSSTNQGREILALVAAGAYLLVSVKPWRAAGGQSSAAYVGTATTPGGNTFNNEAGKLGAYITLLQTVTNNFDICMWQEPNATNNFTAGGYKAWMNFYGAYMRANFPSVRMVYDPSCYSGTEVSFYPGDTYVDVIVGDYYCQGAYTHGDRLDSAGGLMSLADGHSGGAIPFGLGEWGATSESKVPSQSTWENYVNYLLSVFGPRITAGKPQCYLIYYGAGPENGVAGSTSPWIEGIQDVFDSLSTAQPALTVAAGGTLTFTPLTASPIAGYATANGISYDITITITAGASSTNPFAQIGMAWFNSDSPNAPAVDTEHWFVPMGVSTSTGTVITGRGPQRGQYLRIRLSNKDTDTCTVSVFQVNSTARNADRDDWRWDAVASVNLGASFARLSSGASFSNSLGSLNGATVNNGSSGSWLISMYAGRIFIRAKATQDMTFQLNPYPQTGGFGSDALLFESLSANVEFEDEIALPRGPCQITFTNSSGSNGTAYFEAVIEET